MNEGVPAFAAKNETDSKFAALEARISDLEKQLAMWNNLQVAPESGGGGVTFGGNSVFIRINSLTNSSVQMP